ncbi:MAG: AurF N-oxygenase family protein [Mycobacteriaceae bacterium]
MSQALASSHRQLLEHDSDSQAYAQTLKTLSEGSVERHFDPFVDIDWDAPEMAVSKSDSRWVLPPVADPLGGHPWYQSQSLERRIAMGQWRQANIAKVGLQFENILIRGLMQYVVRLPNGSPEYRYLSHEATEECHHTQMFQELVNRIGMDVPGGPRYFRMLSPIIPLFSTIVPYVFFVGVLAGEEPIDHTQKAVLRAGTDYHPLAQRVMQIHVAEEARHISFAHHYLRRKIPMMKARRRFILSLLVPIIMRWLGDVILKPDRKFRKEFNVPKSVIKDMYWRTPESRHRLQELFGDVRLLAHQTNMMNPVARGVWKILKIDGPMPRFRNEPNVNFADAA